MSLLVWLPLNGNLKNKGCADVSISVSGTTSYTDGKIGQALSCNGSTFWNISSITLGSSASIAYWSKTSTNNKMVWVLESVASNKLNIYESGKYTLNTGDGTANPYRDTTNSDIACLHDNLWHHFVITFGSNESLLYIDGNYAGKALTFRNPTTTNGKIKLAGGYNNAHSYDWNGQINDFRVYDHCLSVAEIKEISRGLILHYPLNRIATKNWIPFSLNSDNYTISDYSSRTSGSIINKVYHVTGYQSDTSADTSFSITSKNFITLTSNTDYYLRFYCKSKSDGDLYFGTSGASTRLEDSSSQYVYPPTTFMLGKEYDDYVVLKLHTGTDTQYKLRIGFDVPNIYGVGSYIEFSEVTLSTIESDWFTFDSQNIVNDCSGYNHHGTVTGNLVLDTNTPRYDKCVYFNGSSYINTLPGELVWNNFDNLTIAAWIKPTVKPSNYTGSIGICHNGANTNKGFAISNYGGQFYVNAETGSYTDISSGYTLPLNEWHHCVATLSGTSLNMYVDGVLKKTATLNFGTTANHTSPQIQVGVDLPGTDEKYTGYYSDVRIYVTALSADDVLQLYKVPAKIDKSGNVHTCEFVEKENNKPTVLKVGQTKSNELIELYNYLYLPAGCYVATGLTYAGGDTCKAETVIRYATNGSGRDLMGYSPSGGGYWGVTSADLWEQHGTFSYTNSDITIKNKISYEFYSATENGQYKVGMLASSYSVRNKYIYHVKLYKNGFLERDLYPAQQGSSIGLFDILHNTFYPSNNTNATLGTDNEQYIAKMFKDHIKGTEFIEM